MPDPMPEPMPDPTDLTSRALERGATPGRGYHIALVVSRVLHPMVLGVLSFVVVGMLGTANWVSGLLWALAGIGLLIVPPAVFFTIGLRQGKYSDEDISNRTQRHGLYVFSMANLLVGVIILVLAGAPAPFLAMLCSAIAMTVVAGIINIFWKISVHAASVASFAALVTLYLPSLAVLAWAGAAAIGWARVRTRNHSPLQVLAGAGVAVVVVVVVFAAFGLL